MPSNAPRARANRPPRLSLPPSLLTPSTLARRVEVVAGRLQRVSFMVRSLREAAINALQQYEQLLDGEATCRGCGCTESRACPGGCYWVEDPKHLGDLCSACVPGKAVRHAR